MYRNFNLLVKKLTKVIKVSPQASGIRRLCTVSEDFFSGSKQTQVYSGAWRFSESVSVRSGKLRDASCYTSAFHGISSSRTVQHISISQLGTPAVALILFKLANYRDTCIIPRPSFVQPRFNRCIHCAPGPLYETSCTSGRSSAALILPDVYSTLHSFILP